MAKQKMNALNAIICSLIVMRIMPFSQNGKWQAVLAYFVTLASGIEVILTFYGAISATCAGVIFKAVFAIFIFRARGSIAHLCRPASDVNGKKRVVV